VKFGRCFDAGGRKRREGMLGKNSRVQREERETGAPMSPAELLDIRAGDEKAENVWGEKTLQAVRETRTGRERPTVGQSGRAAIPGRPAARKDALWEAAEKKKGVERALLSHPSLPPEGGKWTKSRVAAPEGKALPPRNLFFSCS